MLKEKPVYGNLALRTFSDLDVLVRERDVLRAKDLIVSQGYQPHVEMTRAEEAAYVHSHRELRLKRTDDKVHVDLQWSIPADWLVLRTFPLSTEQLHDRLQPFSLGGVSISFSSPEDLLLILCVHAASHGWRVLKLACDVAELIDRYPQFDWDLFPISCCSKN